MDQKLLPKNIKSIIFSLTDKFVNKSFLLTLFSTTTLPVLDFKLTIETYTALKSGRTFTIQSDNAFYIINSDSPKISDIVVYTLDGKVTYIKDFKQNTPIFNLVDQVTIEPGEIINFKNDKAEKVSLGRILLNQVVLIDAFKDKIEFFNKPFNIGDVESEVASKLLDRSISMDEYNLFMNQGFYLLHFSELNVPSFTEKSLTTFPGVNEFKKELFEKHKGDLTNPLVAAKIGDALIAKDKEYLEGDPSTGFYNAAGKKAYAIARKKMYLNIGGIESFDKDLTSFNFLKYSLSQGWDKEDFPTISNEIRKGSFGRATATARGGAMTNFMLRVFQDTEIREKNCGVKKGLEFILEKDLTDKFFGRYMIENGELAKITKKNYASYINKKIILRSPMYCLTVDGFCETCCGENFAALDLKAVNMEMVNLTSTFLTLEMKAMHGVALTYDAIDFEEYFI